MSGRFQAFQGGQFSGIVTIIVFAILSTSALLVIPFRAIFIALRSVFFRESYERSRMPLFFRTQLGYYALCLLGCNIIGGIVGLLEIEWAVKRGIEEGLLCTAQGVLHQISNVGSAYFTAALALHTFSSFVLRWKNFAVGVISLIFGWGLAIVIAMTPLASNNGGTKEYGISNLTCGVQRQFALAQFLYHILPIFIGSFVSAVISAIMFLVMRGTLVLNGGVKLSLGRKERWNGRIGTEEEYQRFVAAIAGCIVWVPFAYVLLILPYAITLMADLNGYRVSPGIYALAYVCWLLTGAVNVALFFNTFRILEAARHSVAKARLADRESFASSDRRLVDSREKLNPGSITPPPPTISPVLRKPFPAIPDLNRLPSTRHGPPKELPHHRSTSSSSSASIRQQVVTKQAHLAASRSESPSSDAGPTVGRLITPVMQLNRELAISVPVPEPAVVSRDARGSVHRIDGRRLLRSETFEDGPPPLGLPAPPRRNRSNVSRRPTLENQRGAFTPPPPFLDLDRPSSRPGRSQSSDEDLDSPMEWPVLVPSDFEEHDLTSPPASAPVGTPGRYSRTLSVSSIRSSRLTRSRSPRRP